MCIYPFWMVCLPKRNASIQQGLYAYCRYLRFNPYPADFDHSPIANGWDPDGTPSNSAALPDRSRLTLGQRPH